MVKAELKKSERAIMKRNLGVLENIFREDMFYLLGPKRWTKLRKAAKVYGLTPVVYAWTKLIK